MIQEKIQPIHHKLLACIYIRQSTLQQTKNNKESTRRQRNLVTFAEALGWPASHIKVFDDLGLSGASREGRLGYQRLFQHILDGEVGMILAVEMSRLGRDDLEWQLLLRHCMFSQVLLADEQRIYDPADPNDQILLGILGQLAEYELSVLRKRMHHSWLQKAERGDLHCGSPVGYTIEGDALIKDPNQRVRNVIEILFKQFELVQSAGELTRWCADKQIEIPSYRHGKGCGELRWHTPQKYRLLQLLKNPTYTGTYVFGRRQIKKSLSPDGQITTKMVIVPMDEWPVVIHNNHDAYISWENYIRNRSKLESNRHRNNNSKGVAKSGSALLNRLLTCSQCGSRLHVRYGKSGSYRYTCTNGSKQRDGRNVSCFSFIGKAFDAYISDELVRVVQPVTIEASLRAATQLEAREAQHLQVFNDKIQEMKFNADRAYRQYNRVDPENRLVAAELEQRWNKSLVQCREAEQKREIFVKNQQKKLLPAQKDKLLDLSVNFEAIWFHPTTSISLKKQIVRILIQNITVTYENPDLDACIHWAGGQITSHSIILKSKKQQAVTDLDLRQVMKDLRIICQDSQIVRTLNRANIKTQNAATWTESLVTSYCRRHKITPYSEEKYVKSGLLDQTAAANKLQISPMSILRLIRSGIIEAKQAFPGAPWIISAETLESESVKNAVKSVKNNAKSPLPEDKNQLTLW